MDNSNNTQEVCNVCETLAKGNTKVYQCDGCKKLFHTQCGSLARVVNEHKESVKACQSCIVAATPRRTPTPGAPTTTGSNTGSYTRSRANSNCSNSSDIPSDSLLASISGMLQTMENKSTERLSAIETTLANIATRLDALPALASRLDRVESDLQLYSFHSSSMMYLHLLHRIHSILFMQTTCKSMSTAISMTYPPLATLYKPPHLTSVTGPSTLNESKTKAIIIGSPFFINRISDTVNCGFSFGDITIPYESSVKDLGVIIDSKLNWKDHILKMCKKANALMYKLYFFRNCTTLKLRIHLIQSLLFPLVDYCSTVFCDISH